MMIGTFMIRWMLATLLVMFLVAGCDLFTTRHAQAPLETSDLCGPATSSDRVLDVLDCTLEFHMPEDYLANFDRQNYSFVPDGAALSNHNDLLPWGYDQEASHIRRLLSDQVVPMDSMVRAQFQEEESIEWADSARYLETYTFHVGHVLEGIPREVSGRAEFIFARSIDGTWRIRWWRDEAVGDQATWSDIKALIR